MGKRLRIYFTSDVHGSFFPTSYGDFEKKNMGLFSCVPFMEKDENTLLIDGGDILQGNAFAYYCHSVLGSSKPIAEMMNDIGYDYYTLGNHDFNYGLDYQREYIDNHKGQCLSQNVCDENDEPLFPYTIKCMPNGIRVGLVGIVTDFINVWEKKENIEGRHINNPYLAAKKALNELKGKTDINVCIYHGGFEADLLTGESTSKTTENIGYRICKELDYDILLTGHQHMSVDGQYINGTYVVQPLDLAKEFHCIDVRIDDRVSITSKKIKADCQRIDTNLVEKYSEIYNDVQAWLNIPVGHLSRALLPDEKIRMAFYGSPIADFINRVQLFYSGADISAVGLANEIAGFKKEVTTRDIIATYPFPNTLVVKKINGAQLKKVMERSAEYFDYDEAGNLKVADSFTKTKLEHYNFDYYAGVEYKYDPSMPIGERVVYLSRNHKLIKPDDEFTLCLNNYRAGGAGGYEVYCDCPDVKEINIEMTELLMDYFKNNKLIEI